MKPIIKQGTVFHYEGDDSYTEILAIAAETEAEAESNFNTEHHIDRPNSPYDCTGQRFTSGWEIVGIIEGHGIKPNVFIISHIISIDV